MIKMVQTERVRLAETCLENRLKQEGLGKLTPLLEKGSQATFLREVETLVLERSEQRPKSTFSFETEISGIPVRLTVYPKQRLRGVYGNSGGFWELTSVGKAIVDISRETDGKLFFLAIDGLASEITGIKREENQRPVPETSVYHGYHFYNENPLELDLDLLVLVSGEIDGIEELGKIFKNVLAGKPIETRLKYSLKREGFSSLQICNSERRRKQAEDTQRHWRSLAQIAFAEYRGEYSPDFSLVHFIFSRADLPKPVLLVPTGKNDDETIGVGIGFEKEASFEGVGFRRHGFQRDFTPVFYFPEAFPENCPPEAFYHFLHMVRTVVWVGLLPMLRSDEGTMGAIKEGSFVDSDELSIVSASWFNQHIVRPIVQKPDLLGTVEQRELFTEEFYKSLRQCFDGDPLVSFLLFFEEKNGLFAPIHNLGIISPGGFLPKLYDFLIREERWMRLLKNLSDIKPGAKVGWDCLVDFLFNENRGIIWRTEELLVPSFCPNQSEVPQYIHREIWKKK